MKGDIHVISCVLLKLIQDQEFLPSLRPLLWLISNSLTKIAHIMFSRIFQNVRSYSCLIQNIIYATFLSRIPPIKLRDIFFK